MTVAEDYRLAFSIMMAIVGLRVHGRAIPYGQYKYTAEADRWCFQKRNCQNQIGI